MRATNPHLHLRLYRGQVAWRCATRATTRGGGSCDWSGGGVRLRSRPQLITRSSHHSRSPMAAPTSPAAPFPSMADIMAASRAQGLHMRLRTIGPLFRITATRGAGEEDAVELGRAEGGVRPWPGGAVLHLDSMRMSRETLSVSDRPLFGLGMFLGAVAVRHGFDAGCKRAELLAINDTPLYHDKLVRFYTRMSFKAVHEVDGSSITDLAHMLVWGGRGTRMDADIEELLIKWGKRFRPHT